MFRNSVTPKFARRIAVVGAAGIAVVVALLTTDFGAGVIARVRCAAVWISSDSVSYGACAAFEREQIIEQRRHTLPD